PVRRINRRIVLDDAREKLLMQCNLKWSDYMGRADDLVSEACIRLPQVDDAYVKHLSTVDHLNLIFKTSSIRKDGNAAAHVADRADLAAAVLSADLQDAPQEQRRMVDIFTYTYQEVPRLERAGQV
ncbi:hypothetical protein H0H87_001137, partial [Tephrocybe sp. NHM501043]